MSEFLSSIEMASSRESERPRTSKLSCRVEDSTTAGSYGAIEWEGTHIAEPGCTRNPAFLLMRAAGFALLALASACALDKSGLGDLPLDGASDQIAPDAGAPDSTSSGGGDADAPEATADDGASGDVATGDDGSAGSDDGSSTGDALGTDDAGDAGPMDDGASDGDAPGPTCLDAIPSGWSVAIYDLGSKACPANFVGHDVFGPPNIGPNACACTCSVSQPADCTQGTLSVGVGRGGPAACTTSTFSGAISGPGCTPLGLTVVLPPMASFDAPPLPPQGGACLGASMADPSQLTVPPARYCDVPVASRESVCGGAAPPGFASCIVTSGATSCPAATPFIHAHVVEDGASLVCSDCQACLFTPGCSGATLTAFADPNCFTAPVVMVPADGNCNPLPPHLASSVSAVSYSATDSSTCAPAPATASADLTGPLTLCCR
jgi:hypothetical protein